jgi:lipopolysaccharide/colanic/teichoic acid biosynthesis glycosyltransferase
MNAGLWNVLRGEMALVGPLRAVRYLPRYSPQQRGGMSRPDHGWRR